MLILCFFDSYWELTLRINLLILLILFTISQIFILTLNLNIPIILNFYHFLCKPIFLSNVVSLCLLSFIIIFFTIPN